MDEKIKHAVQSFFAAEGYCFRLDEVSATVGVSVKDLTNWRQRELLPFSPQKIGGRYHVTVHGFVCIGIMAELAWLVGPDVSSQIAERVVKDLMFSAPLEAQTEKLLSLKIVFERPATQGIDQLPHSRQSEGDDEFSPLGNAGFRLDYVYPGQENFTRRRAHVTLPFARLVANWAVNHAWMTGQK